MAKTAPSHSEGEVSTSESEKASQTLPLARDRPVDRTRPHARRNSRSRSRSPYRAPRGEKRRHDDRDGQSSYSPRRENDRYQPNRPLGRSSLRDVPLGHASHSSRHDGRYDAKRMRTTSRSRSRSPFRHSHQDANSKTRSGRPAESRGGSRGDGSDRISQLSVSDRDQPVTAAFASKSSAKSSKLQSPRNHVDTASGLTDEKTAQESRELGGQSLVVDEATLIDERRKRREALKAKFRNQETPLLVQALRAGSGPSSSLPDDTPTSPRKGTSSGVASEAPSPPTTAETPRSPAEVDFEAANSLANTADTSIGDDGEPSAADYDPTADMQEEQKRHETQHPSTDTTANEPDTQRSSAVPSQNTESMDVPKTFDMFAEPDDEDDIFADPTKAKPRAAKDSKAGQRLDVKMMDNWDDPEGYYVTIAGELFESRYHILQNLGRGMFSSVVQATDTQTQKLVAIKIVRNNDSMRKAGLKEIDILKNLAANDAEDKKHVMRLLRSFDHKGHLCMVFENMSLNLREVLKKFGRDVGINIKATRAYAQQLFLGLSLLRKCQYLHADLKPDNILVNEARNVLKICDLGSASSIDENITAPYLVSRFYRAPEVMLGIPYDYGIDIWSIGCTLFELYTGKILFTGRNNNAMLRAIMECRGKFPPKLLRKGSLAYQYFDDLLNFQAIEEDKLTGRSVLRMIDVKAKPVRGLRERLMPKGKKLSEAERVEVGLFADLLDKCLDLRVDKRITPNEALRHAFITGQR